MAHRVSVLAAARGLLGASTALAGAATRIAVSEVAPGIFVHTGQTALMTRENEGAIANVGFIVGETRSR